MADVFINYKREERDVAIAFAAAIEALGYSVWYDAKLTGDNFRQEILSEVRACKCMLVIWSERSIFSEWVRDEADIALRDNKLLPVRIGSVTLPMGFGRLQTADFTELANPENDPSFSALISAIERMVGRAPTNWISPDQTGLDETSEVDVGAPVELQKRSFTATPRARRTKIFIAHASSDKPRLKPIIEALLVQGFRVWIDRPHELGLEPALEHRLGRIHYKDDWQEQIRQAVRNAHVVLAFWSRDALIGDRRQFYYEVYMGLIQQKLRQCRMDRLTEAEIGYPYRFGQMADISNYEVGKYHPELDKLMVDICVRSRFGII